MSGEGMVAVVHSMRDAGLAVTLMDGSRNKFSLVPNSGTAGNQRQSRPKTPQYPKIQLQRQNSAVETDSAIRCDSSAQATDGRFASIYQTTHGKLEPTSPPCEVTEFPPQRAELCPGHGNFEVGGLGSGQTCRMPTRQQPGIYRGGLCWVDRGSVCSPRPSQHIDAFANSLRKYPMVPLERSSEMLERLITYSQARISSRQPGKVTSPTRSYMESEVSHQTYTERSRQARHDDMRSRSRVDEYPTRDGRPRKEEFDRSSRNYEVRYSRDASRSKDAGRPSDFNYHYGRDDIDVPSSHRKVMRNSNSVHMETQAAVPMSSKEVTTVPRSDPVKKNVAVPHSTSTSTIGQREGAVSDLPDSSQVDQNTTKIISFKSVQTTSSSVELVSAKEEIQLRRSKSEDDMKRKHYEQGVIEMIGNMAVNSKAMNKFNENILKDMWIKLHRVLENVEQQNSRERVLINMGKKIKKAPIYIPVKYESLASKDCPKTKLRKWSEIDVYRAALPPFRIENDEGFEDIVKDWVNSLPMKSHDFVGRPIDRMSDILVRRLLKLLTIKAKIDSESLKWQIVDAVNEAPIAITGKCKRNIVNSLVDILISKLKENAPNMFKKDKLQKKTHTTKRKMVKDDIKSWVANIIVNVLKKYDFELNMKEINEMKTGLAEILMNYNCNGSCVKGNFMKENMTMFLSDYLDDDQSEDFANTLLNKIKNGFCATEKYGNRNFVVCLNTSMSKRHHFNTYENLNTYKNDLCEQIDKWLSDLPIEILKLSNKDERSTVITDLAAEIVDRQKYLEFNPSKTTDANELEYLKYQIYKWINKVVGDENINIVEYASDLMDRIQDIPVPKFMLLNPNVVNIEVRNSFTTSAEPFNSSQKDINNSNNTNRRPSILKTCDNKNQTDKEKSGMCSKCTQKSQSRITIQLLNDEYDEYVKNWVKQIPFPANTPEEQESSDKLRLDIHNGIWKALTKLKFDPEAFHNSFYYQDLLDVEIEALFDRLPKSNELDAKKHILKAQLLEYTRNTNNNIIKLAEPASFKQDLVENVVNNIPRNNNDDINDPIKLHEDLQILSIVEDYIVFTNYDEDNKVKANAFRRKLLKNVEAFVEDLKMTHGKDLKDIDIGIYMNDIIEALHNVPLPSDYSLKEEADEILLGIEIEHWFDDLHLVSNDDYFEQLKKRRLREALTKKIVDIENSTLGACAAEKALKEEITKFLQAVPLKADQTTNINFLIEELLNRIKNKNREQGRRRLVAFQQPLSYQEFKFSKEMPQCSSYSSDQSKLSHCLSSAPNQQHSIINQNNNSSFQLPLSFQKFKYNKELPDISNFSSNNSKSNKTLPNSHVHYHPTSNFNQNYNNSTLVGGGMLYNPPEMNATINTSHGYYTFEENRPLSSSMYSLLPNIYGNTPNSRSTEPQLLNLEERNQVSRSNVAAPYAPESAWVSLEEVPIPNEIRRELQPGTRIPQQMKSFAYSNSQSIQLTNNLQPEAIQDSCCRQNETENTSAIPQLIQEQISKINQAAVGHTSNEFQSRNNISLANNSNQVSAEAILRTNEFLNQRNANVINDALRKGFSLTNANRSNAIRNNNLQTNEMYNQSRQPRNNETFDQTIRSVGSRSAILQIQQDFTNRTHADSIRVVHPSAPNISDSAASQSRLIPQHLSIHSPAMIPVPRSTPHHTEQIPTHNLPEILDPQQMSNTDQNQAQPSSSSYGQPQGFSTPHQEINERSPPRIGRKIHDPRRFRSGPARRRLDLDDSDDSGEDCPCMSLFERTPHEDLDYPCFYPFPFPYPYFF